jgi:hypothetical protein
MLKRISFFVTIFTVCIFAENIAGTAPVTTEAEATPVVEATAAAEVEPIAAEAEVTPIAEAEPITAETEAAPVVEAPVVAATPVATESAKEAIIEDPLEFAIVTAAFIATVLLITLTGN